jgi:hypothetical protein
MTEQDLIHKIEWVNKRCSLKREPLTQNQIELLKFVFADTVVNKNFDLADVRQRSELLKAFVNYIGRCGVDYTSDEEIEEFIKSL